MIPDCFVLLETMMIRGGSTLEGGGSMATSKNFKTLLKNYFLYYKHTMAPEKIENLPRLQKMYSTRLLLYQFFFLKKKK
jgi:hypothetical protein